MSNILKPELRIVEWDFTANEFKVLGEVDKYISYVYKLNHNTESTGEIKIDPNEPQAKEFIQLLNKGEWDPKMQDVFIYNLNDEDNLEWFKITKVEISNEENKKTITITGNNSFFMKDRITIPDEAGAYEKGKTTLSNEHTGAIIYKLIKENGATFIQTGTDTYTAIPLADTLGFSDDAKEKRRYPYIAVSNSGATYGDVLEEYKYGYEALNSNIDKLIKGTLYGYRTRLNIKQNKIEFSVVTWNDATDIEISQEFNDENGYKVTLDAVRKIDVAMGFKDDAKSITQDADAKSAGRYKESTVSISSKDTQATINSKLAQELVKNNDYKITDVTVTPINDNDITERIKLGDIITVKIEEGIINFTKESQVKQILKSASDNEYKITPVTDDTAESAFSLIAEKLREERERTSGDNFSQPSGSTAGITSDQVEAKITPVKQEADKLQVRVAATETKATTAKTEATKLQARVTETETKIATGKTATDKLQIRVKAVEDKEKITTASINQLKGAAGTAGHFATEAQLKAYKNPIVDEQAFVGTNGNWKQWVYESTGWYATGGTSDHSHSQDLGNYYTMSQIDSKVIYYKGLNIDTISPIPEIEAKISLFDKIVYPDYYTKIGGNTKRAYDGVVGQLPIKEKIHQDASSSNGGYHTEAYLNGSGSSKTLIGWSGSGSTTTNFTGNWINNGKKNFATGYAVLKITYIPKRNITIGDMK